jgi:hypothetical protein
MGVPQNDWRSGIRSNMSSGSLHVVTLAGCNGYLDQGHYLKISLVLTMERQMLEHELLQLSSDDLEARMIKTSSNHEVFWQARNVNGRADHVELTDGAPVIGLGQVSSAPITSSDTNGMR